MTYFIIIYILISLKDFNALLPIFLVCEYQAGTSPLVCVSNWFNHRFRSVPLLKSFIHVPLFFGYDHTNRI